MGGGGGTEAFPELGRHCQHSECNQLDFLPFKCDGCSKVFCVEHRTYKSHECPKPNPNSRRVVVCEICSTSIEMTNGGKSNKVDEEEEQKVILERHEKSGDCDPSKKKKPKCPVKRCKQILTFSNNSTCKFCQLKVCLSHRFPADHNCLKTPINSSVLGVRAGSSVNDKFLVALAARNAKDCGSKKNNPMSASSSNSVKAY
ncbi:zinc finger protein [Macleaya cordata]|uniref:Zinc finger protein n=1 Tax=Macleaya cordata TaxID=56857 RepID=A0A200QV52_MACCD|nr:zinc finger protein [Macleaya cordata]